jgi:hypothetical protein
MNDQKITDPYETFEYDLTVSVPDDDLPYFGLGNAYLTNSSILNSPSFSEFQVSNVNGNDVTFLVDNISDTSVTPLPSTVILFLSGIVFLGALAKFQPSRMDSMA